MFDKLDLMNLIMHVTVTLERLPFTKTTRYIGILFLLVTVVSIWLELDKFAGCG